MLGVQIQKHISGIKSKTVESSELSYCFVAHQHNFLILGVDTSLDMMKVLPSNRKSAFSKNHSAFFENIRIKYSYETKPKSKVHKQKKSGRSLQSLTAPNSN